MRLPIWIDDNPCQKKDDSEDDKEGVGCSLPLDVVGHFGQLQSRHSST